DVVAADRGNGEHRKACGKHPEQETEHARVAMHGPARPDERCERQGTGPAPERRLVHTEGEDGAEQRDAEQKLDHAFVPPLSYLGRARMRSQPNARLVALALSSIGACRACHSEEVAHLRGASEQIATSIDDTQE